MRKGLTTPLKTTRPPDGNPEPAKKKASYIVVLGLVITHVAPVTS